MYSAMSKSEVIMPSIQPNDSYINDRENYDIQRQGRQSNVQSVTELTTIKKSESNMYHQSSVSEKADSAQGNMISFIITEQQNQKLKSDMNDHIMVDDTNEEYLVTSESQSEHSAKNHKESEVQEVPDSCRLSQIDSSNISLALRKR